MTDNLFRSNPMRFEAVRLKRRGICSFEWLVCPLVGAETGRVEDRLVTGGVGGRLVGAGGGVESFTAWLSVGGRGRARSSISPS